MNKLLIGSCAIKHWFPHFTRDPHDVDYAVDRRMKRDGKTEYLYNPAILEWQSNGIASPVVLLNLKISHMMWDVKWEKHMYDCQFLIRQGMSMNDFSWKFYHKLIIQWEELHGKRKSSNLELDADKFFDNAINGNSGLDHDHIHTILKEVPTYTKILKDGSEVEPSKEKFYKCSYEDQISVVQEEVMVMAYERYRKLPYRVAYTMMLKKFIINHAPVWQVPFIIMNYKDIEKPQMNYIKLIEDELRSTK